MCAMTLRCVMLSCASHSVMRVQVLRAMLLCGRRRQRDGTLRRLPAYLWLRVFTHMPIAVFATAPAPEGAE